MASQYGQISMYLVALRRRQQHMAVQQVQQVHVVIAVAIAGKQVDPYTIPRTMPVTARAPPKTVGSTMATTEASLFKFFLST